jgi:hypothetical protein
MTLAGPTDLARVTLAHEDIDNPDDWVFATLTLSRVWLDNTHVTSHEGPICIVGQRFTDVVVSFARTTQACELRDTLRG